MGTSNQGGRRSSGLDIDEKKIGIHAAMHNRRSGSPAMPGPHAIVLKWLSFKGQISIHPA